MHALTRSLCLAQGATGFAALWQMVLKPFDTKRNPDGAKNAKQLAEMQDKTSPVQPGGNTELQRTNYFRQHQYSTFLNLQNQQRVVLQPFN